MKVSVNVIKVLFLQILLLLLSVLNGQEFYNVTQLEERDGVLFFKGTPFEGGAYTVSVENNIPYISSYGAYLNGKKSGKWLTVIVNSSHETIVTAGCRTEIYVDGTISGFGYWYDVIDGDYVPVRKSYREKNFYWEIYFQDRSKKVDLITAGIRDLLSCGIVFDENSAEVRTVNIKIIHDNIQFFYSTAFIDGVIVKIRIGNFSWYLNSISRSLNEFMTEV